MEPVDNPQEETSQAREALAKQSVLPISPSTLRADDSQQVSCLKGQFSQSVEHLGMCRDVRASSLCQRPLRRRNIEQAANAVAVRLGRRGEGLAGGVEKRGGGLPAPECCFYVGITSPHLLCNLIHADSGLSRGRIAKFFGPQQIVLSSSSIKNVPINAHARCERQAGSVSRRKLLLPSKLILATDDTLELERRVVSRARFSDSGLGCIDFRQLLQEVGA